MSLGAPSGRMGGYSMFEDEVSLLRAFQAKVESNQCTIQELRAWASARMREMPRPSGWLWDQSLCASLSEARMSLAMALEERGPLTALA